MSWEIVELQELCSPKQHKTIATKNLSEEGYPVFGANGQIGFHSTYTHAEPTIAITCRGATCGTVNVTPEKCYINGNAMALDDLDKSKVDLTYLKYFFINRGFHDVISGSAQPQITRAPLLTITLPLPPLAEQKRIAGILDQADALRRQRQRALDHLNQLGQSIFYEMFGDPLSSDTKLEKVPFGEVVRIINGRAYRKHEEREIGTPVIRIQNLNGGERYFYSDMDLPADKYCDEGDLLFAWSATFGPYVWHGGKSIYHYHIWKLECSDRINKEYCFWFLKAISKNVKDKGNGISMTHATKGGMEARPIPLPAIEHQNQFSKIMLAVDSKIKKYKSLLRKSETLFASLQQRAFRGEL